MSLNNKELENVAARDRRALLLGTVRGTGFEDASGENPTADYFFEQGTEKSTRGVSIHNLETDVSTVIGREDISLTHSTPSDAAQVSIKTTPKGHVALYDDTIGSERILLKHLCGAGVEIKPDGSVIVNARGNRVDLITGNHHLFTEGNGNLTYSGDLTMNIGGDFNLDVGGNYNLKVGGHWIVNVFGSYTKRIIGMMAETIQKVKSTTVLKDVTNTFLGKLSTSVKEDYEFIVRGESDYNHKGSTTLTSQTEISLTSPNINVVAQDLTATGNTGTIGGENIVMYNYNMFTGHSINAIDTVTTKSVYATDTLNSQTITGTRINSTSMHASTFHGDLNGTAQNAVVGGTDTHPGSSHGFSVSSIIQAAVDVTTANTTKGPKKWPTDAASDYGPSGLDNLKPLPTETTTSVFLDKSAYMVQSVFVDDDDGIYNYMDKTVTTAGVTDKPLTTSEIRIKLRNPANKSNLAFVNECIANDTLSSSYSEKVPEHVNRILGKKTQSRMGSNTIGAADPGAKTIRYKPTDTSKKQIKFIVPEAQYNPNNIKDIKMGTLLSPGIPVAKFFPNSETMNDMSQVERHRMARNLVATVKLLKLVKVPKFMEGFNIKIVEGVQKLGTTDVSAPSNSITKLSATGRVVGFEVRNSRSGDLSPGVTFDLAAYLKDNAEYDKLIMSYDTYEVDELSSGEKILYASIIVVMPEIPQNYNVTFKQEIETHFNNEPQSTKDLIEITLSETGSIELEEPTTPAITDEGLKKIKTKNGFYTFVSAAVWNNFQAFINKLEGPDYNYEIKTLDGYATTTQRYSNLSDEFTGEDLWTSNASGLGININISQNLKGTTLVHDFPNAISQIARAHGLGWGGDFSVYKDASLFSMRDEEGGSIPAPRTNKIYQTAETKAEAAKPVEEKKQVPEPKPKKDRIETKLPFGTYGSVEELTAAAKAGKHAPGSILIYHDVDGEQEWFKKYGNYGYDFGPTEYRVYISRAIPSNHLYMATEIGSRQEEFMLGQTNLNWILI